MNGASTRAPVWLMPDSSFGILLLTTFISDSHVLPIPVSLASQPRRCSEPLRVTSRRRIQLDYVVGKASSSVVTNERCFPRLPLVAQRVHCRGNMFARPDNDEADTHCALNDEPHASCRTIGGRLPHNLSVTQGPVFAGAGPVAYNLRNQTSRGSHHAG